MALFWRQEAVGMLMNGAGDEGSDLWLSGSSDCEKEKRRLSARLLRVSITSSLIPFYCTFKSLTHCFHVNYPPYPHHIMFFSHRFHVMYPPYDTENLN